MHSLKTKEIYRNTIEHGYLYSIIPSVHPWWNQSMSEPHSGRLKFLHDAWVNSGIILCKIRTKHVLWLLLNKSDKNLLWKDLVIKNSSTLN